MSELDQAEILLRDALAALNGIKNQRVRNWTKYRDTYALAAAIDAFFKDVAEGAYRED
jgi:hypothetical protein